MDEKLYVPPLRKYAYLYKGFPDNTYPPHEYLKEILNFMDLHIKEKNGKVLVHCAMGISRSGGLVVAWFLKENPTWSWSDSMKFVWKSRQVLPAVEIRESILDYLESIENRRRMYK
jgi:protein-tyrosine phosphatase